MSITEQNSQKVWENNGNLPLLFIPNRGQTQKEVRFYGQRSGCGFYFTQEEAMFVFQRNPSRTPENDSEPPTDTALSPQRIALALHFFESNPKAQLEAQKEGSGKFHFLTGNDPAKWVTNLPTYHEILYRELWPGVDLIFQEGNGQLKYLLMVQPGAQISNIRMTYRGSDDLSLDEIGNLQIHTPSEILIDERPISYQEISGMQVPVTSFFVIEEEENGEKRFGFGIGEDYDPRYPLLIDPGLVYSTYLGASGLDQATRIAVDALGQAYVTGLTNSPNFLPIDPVLPPDPVQPVYGGGVSDAFVTKLTADGSDLVFSTYLGGSGEDRGLGIAVDDAGNAHVTGLTNSLNFPVTAATAFQPTYQGGAHDAFYAKISADGSTLLYSTYLGGAGDDISAGVEVDASGKVYLAGQTDSTNFPITLFAVQNTYQGGAHDAFVSTINPFLAGAASLPYSTYLGGSGDDRAMDIALDPTLNGVNFYVTGATNSPNFLPTDPIQPVYGGGVSDAFVTKFFSSNLDVPTSVVYSTFLGGSGLDEGRGIDVDTDGRAYVTGRTNSLNFPGTPLSPILPTDPVAPPQPAFQGGASDAFLAILNAAGTAIDYATYLGGSDEDVGNGITVNPFVFVTGFTRSLDFPVTAGAVQPFYQGGPADAFVTKIDTEIAGLGAIVYSTFLGGTGDDEALGIALDAAENGYVTGFTNSLDFPTTPNAFQRTYQGGPFDGFVSKLDFIPLAPPVITCSPDITVINDPGQCGAVVDFPTPTVSDECPLGFTVSCTPPSGSFFPVGTSPVTCTVTDPCGGSASCSFTVTVVDTEPPVIICPTDITVFNDPGRNGAFVNFSEPTVSDNCPGVTSVCSPAPGAFFPPGTTTVTCTATDAAGNTSTCSFNVRVIVDPCRFFSGRCRRRS